MADQLQSAAKMLLLLNFCMYAVVLGIGAWAMNRAIDHGFVIGTFPHTPYTVLVSMHADSSCGHVVFSGADFYLPAHFSPIYFPMGNAATGFFVVFALMAGVVGAGAAIAGINHVRAWHLDSMPAAVSAATIAWSLTLLAMG